MTAEMDLLPNTCFYNYPFPPVADDEQQNGVAGEQKLSKMQVYLWQWQIDPASPQCASSNTASSIFLPHNK